MQPHNEKPGAFDQNIKSEACVKFDDETYWSMPGDSSVRRVYYQGCFWGGKVPAVLSMIDELEAWGNRDLEKDVIAQWHDESHINRYFIDREFDVHTFGPEYAYPEVFDEHCNFEPKIVHLAKDNSKYQQWKKNY